MEISDEAVSGGLPRVHVLDRLLFTGIERTSRGMTVGWEICIWIVYVISDQILVC